MWHVANLNVHPHAAAHFKAWIETHYERITDIMQAFVKVWLENLEKVPSVENEPLKVDGYAA